MQKQRNRNNTQNPHACDTLDDAKNILFWNWTSNLSTHIKTLISFQLLNVIRHNSVIIIVGETGSGKTTQLTQVGMGVTKLSVIVTSLLLIVNYECLVCFLLFPFLLGSVPSLVFLLLECMLRTNNALLCQTWKKVQTLQKLNKQNKADAWNVLFDQEKVPILMVDLRLLFSWHSSHTHTHTHTHIIKVGCADNSVRVALKCGVGTKGTHYTLQPRQTIDVTALLFTLHHRPVSLS